MHISGSYGRDEEDRKSECFCRNTWTEKKKKNASRLKLRDMSSELPENYQKKKIII